MNDLGMFLNDVTFVKYKLNDLTKAFVSIKEQEQILMSHQYEDDYTGPYMLEAIESVIQDLMKLEKNILNMEKK